MFKKLLFHISAGMLFLPSVALAQDKANFPNPLEVNSLQELIGGVIARGFLGIIGSIGLLMLIIGGLMWLTAAGNSDRIEKSKTILVWSVLGMVVVFGAYTIVSAIFRFIP